METLSAKAVANYFLGLAAAEGRAVTPLQIQKLVYIAHGWFLALHNRPLIYEPVEAWRHGPVIRSLYYEFSPFGNRPITDHAMHISKVLGEDVGIEPHIPVGNDFDAARRLLDRVWHTYGGYDGVQLSSMTHYAGTPWHETTNRREAVIPNERTRSYYQRIRQERDDE